MRALRPVLLLLATLLPAAGVFADATIDHGAGKDLFERAWLPLPASPGEAAGLGPLFSENSCLTCHGGPGGGATVAFNLEGIVARGVTAHLGDEMGRPDPLYGSALQPKAVAGLTGEGTLAILSHDPADRLIVTLIPSRGPLAPETRISIRLSPPLVARARIESVDEAAILALADPDDRDGDGISGRANLRPNASGPRLGRLGWKATEVDLDHQIAHAFAIDIGLSSPLEPFPHGDCTKAESDCLAMPHARSARFDGEEISGAMVEQVASYVRGLEPPPSPPSDPTASLLFSRIGCAACHIPSLPAKGGGSVKLYSDLLLHDLGPALDDGVGAQGAASQEWRTTPLAALAWSMGSTRRYLHDGSAPSLDAAIRGHGGEAAAAARKYDTASADERALLISFLEGL